MFGIGRRSTTLRVSLGVASLTICLLLTAEMIGILPNTTDVKLDARQKAVELVAVQVASAATRNDVRMVQTILTTIVGRDVNILSAALRRRGSLLATAGPHDRIWEAPVDGISTPTHVQVPIMKQKNEWGLVELTFRPLQAVTLATWRESPFAVFIFVGLAGFVMYFLFLRRALAELDPSSVVPEHVRSAFNALAEGVIIIDEEERIVLANDEFANMIRRSAESLIGVNASELDWITASADESDDAQYPWQKALLEGKAQIGVPLRMRSSKDHIQSFVVNGSPILDGKGRPRGALATFDDVSEVEKMNEELESAMTNLSQSREAVERKNKELQYLATRDSLTSLLNRRALFELFEQRFEKARRGETPLTALMIDIDEFKSINDNFGHAAGDQVIEYVAKKIVSFAKFGDLSARYGGEEFCMILPGTTLDDAIVLAEQLRVAVSEDFEEQFLWEVDLTISLGVASIGDAQDTTTSLLNRADKALYAAKTNGRNLVVKWGDNEPEVVSGKTRVQHENHAKLVRKTMSAGP